MGARPPASRPTSSTAEPAAGSPRASSTEPGIWTLGAITTVSLFTNGVANLLLPLYFAELGVNPAGIGALIAVYYLAMVPTEAGWGLLFDRHGPRWLLAGASLGSG